MIIIKLALVYMAINILLWDIQTVLILDSSAGG